MVYAGIPRGASRSSASRTHCARVSRMARLNTTSTFPGLASSSAFSSRSTTTGYRPIARICFSRPASSSRSRACSGRSNSDPRQVPSASATSGTSTLPVTSPPRISTSGWYAFAAFSHLRKHCSDPWMSVAKNNLVRLSVFLRLNTPTLLLGWQLLKGQTQVDATRAVEQVRHRIAEDADSGDHASDDPAKRRVRAERVVGGKRVEEQRVDDQRADPDQADDRHAKEAAANRRPLVQLAPQHREQDAGDGHYEERQQLGYASGVEDLQEARRSPDDEHQVDQRNDENGHVRHDRRVRLRVHVGDLVRQHPVKRPGEQVAADDQERGWQRDNVRRDVGEVDHPDQNRVVRHHRHEEEEERRRAEWV